MQLSHFFTATKTCPSHLSQHFGVRLLSEIFGKKRLNTRGFAQVYLRSCLGYGPGRSVKRRSKSSSLHSKKNFCLGDAGFLWVTS